MKDLNRAQLIGHLGQDPAVTYTERGVARTTFSVATSARWKDAAGQVQELRNRVAYKPEGALSEPGKEASADPKAACNWSYRKHSTMWSLTIPTACMKA